VTVTCTVERKMTFVAFVMEMEHHVDLLPVFTYLIRKEAMVNHYFILINIQRKSLLYNKSFCKMASLYEYRNVSLHWSSLPVVVAQPFL